MNAGLRKFGTGSPQKGEIVEGSRDRGSRESEMPWKPEDWKRMNVSTNGHGDWEARNGVRCS